MSRPSARGQYQTCIAVWESGSCPRSDIASYGYCFGHTQQRTRGQKIGPIRFYRPAGLVDKALALWIVEVSTDTPTECREWPFAYNGNGYGVVSVGPASAKVRTSPHRVVARWLVGTGEALNRFDVVHHVCANRACVNPKHLEITTAQHNASEAQLRKEVEILREKVVQLEAIIAEVLNTTVRSRSTLPLAE